MANKYFKNFILCGDIDYHCIICEEDFQLLADVDRHLRWETHRKSVKSQIRSTKFKKDAVFKIGEKFYCETCNYVTPDINTMNSHVGEELHQLYKEKPKREDELRNCMCQRESGYVILSDIIVENRDWHGIVGKECVICGTKVSSVAIHIHSCEHVLNLIQAKIIVDKDKCYRKIKNNLFYCFICKKTVPMKEFESHWLSKEHIEKTKLGIYRAMPSQCDVEDINSEQTKLYYDVNVEKRLAVCKKCKFVLRLDYKAMIKHSKEHKDNPNKEKSTPVINVECPSSSEEESEEVMYLDVQDHGKRRSEMAKFGKENFIKLNPGGSMGYCSLCHVNLSAHLRLFKEHVRGSYHKGHLEVKGMKKAKEHSVPNCEYMCKTECLVYIFYARPVKLLWINKEFAVDIQSFIMVSDVEYNPHYKMTKCYVCEIYYPQGEDLEHYKTEKHKKGFLNAKVLHLDEEFVREIRPDVYHCGFCSKVYPFWDLMEKHLASYDHRHKKAEKFHILRVVEEWFDVRELITVSSHPDIMYIQFMNMGIFSPV